MSICFKEFLLYLLNKDHSQDHVQQHTSTVENPVWENAHAQKGVITKNPNHFMFSYIAYKHKMHKYSGVDGNKQEEIHFHKCVVTHKLVTCCSYELCGYANLVTNIDLSLHMSVFVRLAYKPLKKA